MTRFANLELYVRHAESAGADYRVEARFMGSYSEVDFWAGASLAIDFEDLRARLDRPEEYGRALSALLFGDAAIKELYDQARASAHMAQLPLRLLLHIDRQVSELHALRWELVHDPGGQGPLFTDENVLFSRYMRSRDWRSIRLGARDALRVLVVVANPTDLGKFGLAPIDVDAEVERIRASVQPGDIEILASGGQATLEGMMEALRRDRDVVYLLAHGRMVTPSTGEPAMPEPRLWLEAKNGTSAVVRGTELARRMAKLQRQPRLVVLDSCQSAGSEHAAMPLALGPRLIEAGIPAVLAMHGEFTTKTAAVFMPAFFSKLRDTGQIDHAVAVARGAVRHRHDFWMPVLFMRLRGGRIWYEHGLSMRNGEPARYWDSLVNAILDGVCIPLLGPGLLEPYVGVQHTIARRLAEAHHFPMEHKERLPAVAQYLLVENKRDYMNKAIGRALYAELKHRFASVDALAMSGSDEDLWKHLDAQLQVAAAQLREQPGAFCPHDALAALGLPYYITTNPFGLLGEALRAAGKRPASEICAWKASRRTDLDTGEGKPTGEQPLIYHLLGHAHDVDGIVFTEDDYFDFLIQFFRKDVLIPGLLKEMLLDNTLLLLGFRMEDWGFRVMLRTILNLPGKNKLADHIHVAAQFDPEDGLDRDPEVARAYLEDYFREFHVQVYWGGVEDFLGELHTRLDYHRKRRSRYGG